MIGENKMNGLRKRGKPAGLSFDAALSDDAMADFARSMAARLSVNDRARIKMSLTSSAIERLSARAGQLAADSLSIPAAMEWLTGNIRSVEAAARGIEKSPSPLLAARDGEPRLMKLTRELVAHSDANVSGDRLTRALAAFDEVQGLSMAELWLAPKALQMALIEGFYSVACQVTGDQQDRLEAEKWVADGAPRDALKPDTTSAFCERALKLMHDEDMGDARRALEEWLEGRAGGIDAVILGAHERQAMNRLLLSNIMTSLRGLTSLNWDERFEKISRADRRLREDSVYPLMDKASRARVRDQVARLSRRSGLSEWTVSHHAVRASLEEEEGSARSTCCWWLYDDTGRRLLMKKLGAEGVPISRITFDPTGKWYLGAFAALAFILCLVFNAFAGRWYYFAPLFILSWRFSHETLGTFVTRVIRPRALLKLEVKRVKDEWRTLVVVPALLSSEERARELVNQLEALGVLSEDDNIEYLLLGDFRDGENQSEDDDEAILQAARSGIDRLNRKYDRKRYHYLHRMREYVGRDKRFMGHERKRGALMALNRLLLTGQSQFEAEDSSAPLLEKRFRYVITLDCDTRVLPGTLTKMIGAIAHPINRVRMEDGRRVGYALISPRVEQSSAGRFARLFAGPGGVDSYPTTVSSLYQDLCGRGVFGGKGIYEVEPFASQLEGRIPDSSILSHDLLEGALAGAGYLSDVTVHDGFPGSLSSYLKRLSRWTRGDWQLAPFVFGHLPLDALSRFMMLDNLARSLSRAAALIVIVLSVWTGNSHALIIGVLESFLPLLLSIPHGGFDSLKRAVASLAILPIEAYTQVDAVVRALHRVFVTRQKLLEWTPAADAERQPGGHPEVFGRVLAILILPACLRALWAPAALGLALMFFAGVNWMSALAKPGDGQKLSGDQIAALRDLAGRTWRFFEAYVPLDSPGLPPDNVQFDPPVGIAKRTSPTNIGLYLLSCLCAKELNLIGEDEMSKRLEKTISTLESLDKWRGQLYNWYDLDTLKPLPPRYVSTVDGGNLAACLLLLESAIASELAERCGALARAMDFSSLYDKAAKLFYIGMDVERDKVSESRYDLLASEARILSFVAIMLNQAPVEHWFSLGRARTGHALISWSGTLFEYLMPELFLRAGEGSLIDVSNREVVRLERAAYKDVWGVSESGFFAFDLMMNYQYRAFGLSALSLRGSEDEKVISPYSSMLALPIDPEAAADNLSVMLKRGWVGEYGLYEAVDFSSARLSPGVESVIVKSHMAHHQGMILSAVASALTGDSLVKHFLGIPEARALSLLLEEKSAPRERKQDRTRRSGEREQRRPLQRATRLGRTGTLIPDGHLLYGGGATCYVEASGAGFYRVRGVLAGRVRDGLLPGEHDGLFVHVGVDGRYIDQTKRVQFGEGEANWAGRQSDVECRISLTVSPEDGALTQLLDIKNLSDEPRAVEVTGCFEVALCAPKDLSAHPAFQNLFVKSESMAHGALLFSRSPRDGEHHPFMLYALDAPRGASISYETDLGRLLGRDGALDDPRTLPQSLSGTLGFTLNPCAALRAKFVVAPGDKVSVTLLTGIYDAREGAENALQNLGGDSAVRARVLALTQARAMLDYLSIDQQTHHLLQRASAYLFYPQLKLRQASEEKLSLPALWALGISGDLPIITVFISQKEQMGLASSAARGHEFYRAMGVWCDLVLVNDYGNDYLQPVRDQLMALIDASHLRELSGQPGGVRLIEGQSLTSVQRALLKKSAALLFEGGAGSLAAQLRRLLNVNQKTPLPPPPMRHALGADNARKVLFNGWGGFLGGGRGYRIELKAGSLTPAAWCNVLAAPRFGAIVSERGGGFTWALNARLSRITPFAGDPLREGFPETLTLIERATGRAAHLLPVAPPARVTHTQGASEFESGAEGLTWTLTQFVDSEHAVKCTLIRLTNRTERLRNFTLAADARFIMGAGAEEARLTEIREMDGLIAARGAMEGAGYISLEGAQAQDGALKLPLTLEGGATREYALLLGWNPSLEGCETAAKRFCELGPRARLEKTLSWWNDRLTRIELITPDAMINDMVNRFLPYQTMASRLFARAGLYQAGGAYGFRDQLQDMLSLIPIEPERVREHLLLSASRQFESGDVMHWWHPPALGVRTRISDDLLFLPYVLAHYVKETGDKTVLDAQAPYLKDLPLPDGKDDIYAEAQASDLVETLSAHAMRAIRRAATFGAHGLPLIGSGDWNDGMNRVGDGKDGESVWLAEFMAVVARDYAAWCARDEEKEELLNLSERMKEAAEEHGWDGQWYRRAYHRDGLPMGSDHDDARHGCRIDLIAQGWAVAAGLDDERVHTAMDEAWRQLVNEQDGIIHLLTPPFDGEAVNPGYIAAYPPGVRENGGQYTHGACWGVMGWALLNDAERAWKAFQMLLPYNHALNPDHVKKYRVEPYVVAADVYGEPPHTGRGGWTWYTGAAAWLCRVALNYLLGTDRRGDEVRLDALLPKEWDEASVRLTVGQSQYLLTASRKAQTVTLDGRPAGGEFITLTDDGCEHKAVFPVRRLKKG